MGKLKYAEHKFKAMVFSLFRPMLKRGPERFSVIDGTRIMKVLFLRPEKIGDMVISFPVFDGLKKHYPHIQISVVGSPRNYAIISDDPRFSHIYLYHKRPIKDLREILRIRREKFDAVVDMICDDSVTALFMSQMMAPGKPRIGVGKDRFAEYYDFNYDHRRGNTGHIIYNTLKLLDAFGIDSESVDGFAPPYVTPQALEQANGFVDGISSADRPTFKVAYNLSAGSPTRYWPEEKSRELLQRILDYRPDAMIVLFTVGNDRERANRLIKILGARAVNVPVGLSLSDASALLSRMDLLISPDTSLVHIARSFRVPVVGLYSRFMYNFMLWRPYMQQDGAVVSGNEHNIHDITVDQVFDAFVTLVEQEAAVRR